MGGYVIVDGGYTDHICFIDPDKHRLHRQAVLWSEWVESIRKDVECFFGILKCRWRFFRNGVAYHSRTDIEKAFKTACVLNNMVLLFDGLSGFNSKVWENVEWDSLDPEGTDDNDEDDTKVQNVNMEISVDDVTDLEESIDTSISTSVTAVNEVTIFHYDSPKLELKKALQQSFVVQWIKQQLQWPKSFDHVILVVDDNLNRLQHSINLMTSFLYIITGKTYSVTTG
jgi:hypothetical protein